MTTKDDQKTPRKDESKFIGANGSPNSQIKLDAGDIIGTTSDWDLGTAKTFYSGYPISKIGTFHFAFMKYEFVQNYRSKAAGGNGVADDDLLASMSKEERQKTAALSWYVAPLSPMSPVKCFKK